MPRPGQARQNSRTISIVALECHPKVKKALDKALKASREYFAKNSTQVCFLRDTIKLEFCTDVSCPSSAINSKHALVVRVQDGVFIRLPVHDGKLQETKGVLENIRVTLKFGGSVFVHPSGTFGLFQTNHTCPPGFMKIESRVRGQS
jgi:hypothetical protein